MAKFTIRRVKTADGAYELGADGVDEITYLRTGYNKGYQFDGAVFLVTYDGSDDRKLIPAGHVTSINVRREEDGEEALPEAEVALPQ